VEVITGVIPKPLFKLGLKTCLEGKDSRWFMISFMTTISGIVFSAMCDRLARGGIAAVVDMAWGGWIRGRKAAADMGIPYIRSVFESNQKLTIHLIQTYFCNMMAIGLFLN